MVDSPRKHDISDLLRLAAAGGDETVLWLEDLLSTDLGADSLVAYLEAGDPRVVELDRLLHGESSRTVDPLARAVEWELLSQLAETSAEPWAGRARRAMLRCEDEPTFASTASDGMRRAMGRYELIESVGEGATGVVFRARHRDSGHPAAVKLLRLDAVGADATVRFRREARIAGRLVHPGIARIFDSGVDLVDGIPTPWIASEFVEGSPFAYREPDSTLDQLLETFVSVCDAVGYAHAQGVVHRDLKPQNVLVDRAGLPCVVDFGTARLVADETGHHTRTGHLLGTPAYMAPEVGRTGGSAASPTADVWSLGTMLYEALVGVRPFQLDGLGLADVLRVITETAPLHIDRVASRRIPRPLAAIVMKSIHELPARRYPTAAELGLDLRRFLRRERVLARRPSAFEEVVRIVRRNRVQALVAVAILLLSAIGAAVSSTLLHRAQRAERAAAASVAEAIEAVAMVTDLAGSLSETTINGSAQRESLDRALGIVRRQRAAEGSPAALVGLEARLQEYAGDLALRVGDIAAAAQLRAAVLVSARARHRDAELAARELALAIVKVGDVALDTSGVTVARRAYEEAHEIFVAESSARPGDRRAKDDLCWSLERLASIARQEGRRADAEDMARERRSVAEELVAAQADAAALHNASVATIFFLQCVGRDVDVGDRVAMMRQALSRCRDAVLAAPDRRAYRIVWQNCHEALAAELFARGESVEGLAALSRAVALAEDLFELDPFDAAYAHEYMLALRLMAAEQQRLGSADESELRLERSFTVGSEVCASRPEFLLGRLRQIRACESAMSLAIARQDRAAIAKWVDRVDEGYDDLARMECVPPVEMVGRAWWIAVRSPRADRQRGLALARELVPVVESEPSSVAVRTLVQLLVRLGDDAAASRLESIRGTK